MNCPLCDKKTIVYFENGATNPSFTCPTNIYVDDLEREYPHYTKVSKWISIYEEHALILPYRILNVYENTEHRKPYCQIYKLKLENMINEGKKWRWKEILFFPYTIDILKYKKMRNRINNLILFS